LPSAGWCRWTPLPPAMPCYDFIRMKQFPKVFLLLDLLEEILKIQNLEDFINTDVVLRDIYYSNQEL
jgi:hypothetical protein